MEPIEPVRWKWDLDEDGLYVAADLEGNYEDFADEEEALAWLHESMLRLAIGLYPITPNNYTEQWDYRSKELTKQAQEYVRSLEV